VIISSKLKKEGDLNENKSKKKSSNKWRRKNIFFLFYC
jgi:hypothetical protein